MYIIDLQYFYSYKSIIKSIIYINPHSINVRFSLIKYHYAWLVYTSHGHTLFNKIITDNIAK
ncbi:hypothetical protein Cassandra_0434 [Pseudomonas phage Cassandra]|nr:hypothetical protein Cassandra_0434 [Pseudomonas phage Cassandra]